MNDFYSHCPRCGQPLTTGGCISCNWPNTGFSSSGVGRIDTGDIHRAPLLARIALLEKAVRMADEMRCQYAARWSICEKTEGLPITVKHYDAIRAKIGEIGE